MSVTLEVVHSADDTLDAYADDDVCVVVDQYGFIPMRLTDAVRGGFVELADGTWGPPDWLSEASER